VSVALPALTLRNRLLVAVAVILVAIAVGGYVIATTQHRDLVAQVDRQLEAAVPATRSFATRTFPVEQRPAERPRFAGNPSELFVGLLGTDDVLQPLLERSLQPEAAPDVHLVDVVPRVGQPGVEPNGQGALPSSRPWTVDAVAGDTQYRVIGLARRDGTYLVVGLSLDRVDETFDRLLATLTVVAVVVLLVVGLVVWWVMRLGVRPLRHMTDAAVAIAEGDLSRRIEPAAPQSEAGQLGHALNVMLDTRQQADDRLRQFVADASHELRTPLTSIRGYVDLYRAGGLQDEEALRDAMRRVGQEAGRMSGLVEDLLRLARLDLGRPVDLTTVDLAELARDAVADARAVQPDRPIALEAPERAVVVGDEALLRQAVGAVVTNALVHTGPEVPVTVTVADVPGGLALRVRDEGPGMAPDVAAHAFDRFFRGDPGRSRHRGGNGLGLAIVRSVLTAHGGTATLETAPGAGTTVVLRLPALPAPAAAAPAVALSTR
jgi:two-component system OmpR family sensor kinase